MAAAQANRTHCPKGHEYNEQNTCYSGGHRHCRACARDRRVAKRTPKPTIAEAVWSRFVRAGNGCWVWTGSRHVAGYGCYGKPSKLAHRLVYELLVGPIPEGLTLDHLCRNRICVNPLHLEPVTIAENVMRGESPPAVNARKTHCPQGHPYDVANTYVNPSDGHRQCMTCNRERVAA